MADSDKLSLGLDDLIRLDRTSNNRRGGAGGRGGNRGFRSRGGGRPVNNANGFQTRGGGGIVTLRFFFFRSFVRLGDFSFSRARRIRPSDAGNTISSKARATRRAQHNERPA